MKQLTEKQSQPIDIATLSAADLEQLLADKKKEEREQREKEKTAYERKRDRILNALGMFAGTIERDMQEFKKNAFDVVAGVREMMLQYGDIRNGEKNKGNFEIKNERYKVIFSSHVNKSFDERAELAETKLKKFLQSFVKKRDQDTYKIVMSLLERNKRTGDFDITLINRLYQLEDQFDDQDWKDAIKLFKEAYNPTNTKQYIRIFRKNANDGWDAIVLDFANAKLPVIAETTEAK